MTVAANDRRAGPYTVGTVFPFDFTAFEEDADYGLRVVLTDSGGVESDLVNVVDYTVALNPDQELAPGGDVTKLSAIPAGGSITIIGNLEFKQALDIENLGGYKPRTVMQALDRITILCQQTKELFARSILLPVATTLTNLVMPIPGVGKFLRGRSDGLGWENADIGALGAIGLPVSIANGGTNATTAANARTNLGLASGAVTTVGTAAVLNAGTAANNLVQLDGSAKLPAVDGSQLTGLTSGLVTVAAKTANYNVVAGDRATEVEFTTAGFSLNLLAAATAGNGFTLTVRNAASSGDVTIDPNGAETIDGFASRVLRPGDCVMIRTNGVVWKTTRGDYSFESAEQNLALSTVVTAAHGLPVKPNFLRAVFRCKTAEHGYSIGDEIDVTAAAVVYGMTLMADATNCKLTLQQTYPPYFGHKTSADSVVITYGNWKAVFYAKDMRG